MVGVLQSDPDVTPVNHESLWCIVAYIGHIGEQRLHHQPLDGAYKENGGGLLSSGVSANNYSYDDEGQTESVSGDSNVDYHFDGTHHLVAYSGGGQSNTYYYYGIGNYLRAQRNGTITRYVLHGLGVMAFVDAATNQLYVYHHDANQNIVNRYAHSAYGKILAEN